MSCRGGWATELGKRLQSLRRTVRKMGEKSDGGTGEAAPDY